MQFLINSTEFTNIVICSEIFVRIFLRNLTSETSQNLGKFPKAFLSRYKLMIEIFCLRGLATVINIFENEWDLNFGAVL